MKNTYKISKEIKGYNTSIKLDLNEYDYTHPAQFYDIINNIQHSKTITHYSNIYNDTTKNLINKLAIYNNIEDYNILLTAGSDNGLEYIINTYINKNTHVYLFYPTYNYFEILIKRKTDTVEYIYIDINQNNYDIHLENVQKNSVVYIVNPNNPLGNIINSISLEKNVVKYSEILFIVDEAYIEFCEEHTCVNMINKYDNLIIVRTFSKGYGLAGLRLGYIISSKTIIEKISEIYNEKTLIELTKCAGLFVMNNMEYYKNTIKNIIHEREKFQVFLKENNIYFIPSYANFVFFYVGDNYNILLDKLESNNIIIRNKNSDKKGFLRISIGTPENMEIVKIKFIEHLYLFSSYDKILNIYCSGVYDLCHLGHMELFEKIHILFKNKKYILIVGVHSDSDCESYKRKPVISEDIRYKTIRYCKYVDYVIENAPLQTSAELIKKYNIDYVAIGEEYRDTEKNIFFHKDALELNKYFYVPRCDLISTTDIIQLCKEY